MLKGAKRFIRKLVNKLGFEVIKIENANTFELGSWISSIKVSAIIDVGSNEGQFVNSINRFLPGKRIFAFEPIKNCYEKLKINTKGLDIVCFNFGLSDQNTAAEINVSENLVSSSILPMETLHKELYPQSQYVSKQKIELRRLDDALKDYELKSDLLLKIDVQGYEEKVICGAKETISKVSVVIIEYSYQPIYEGQWLFDDTYAFFTANGFKFVGIADQARSSKNGIPVYGDAIFVRKELTKTLY